MSSNNDRHNPFQAALKNFDIAAETLNLDRNIRERCRLPERELAVNFQAVAEKYGIPMRHAAHVLAVDRVAEAVRVRSIYP